VNRNHFAIASISCWIWIVVVCASANKLQANELQTSDRVQFDAPALAAAHVVKPEVAQEYLATGRCVRIKLPVSVFQRSNLADGQLQYIVIRVVSPYHTMRVVDFSPRTQTYTTVEGHVAVRTSLEDKNQLGAKAAFPPTSAGQLSVDASNQQAIRQEESFNRLPETKLLSSSGTLMRGSGAFFKFLAGPHAVLEGSREVAILAEVSPAWRGDLLHVSVQALGTSAGQHASPVQLGYEQMWTAVHLAGDVHAASAARRYVSTERSLRQLAGEQHKRVVEKALPTVFHKLGAALDIVEPKVSGDYLVEVLFSGRNKFRDHPEMNRLPMDLQVAIQDYWQMRSEFMTLAQPPRAPAAAARNTSRDISAL